MIDDIVLYMILGNFKEIHIFIFFLLIKVIKVFNIS